MKSLFSTRIITGTLGIALLTLISVSWICYRNAAQLIKSTNQQIDSQTELSLLKEIFVAVKKAEIEFKSYLITKKPIHWEEYKINSTKIDQKINHIQQLNSAKADQDQKEQLSQLQNLLYQRRIWHQKIIDLKNKNKLSITTQLVLMEKGNTLTNKIGWLISNLESQKQKQLQIYNQQSPTKIREFIVIVMAGYSITLAIFCIVYYFLYRHIKEQHENENLLLQIKDKLEVVVEQRTVELQNIFNQLKQELNARREIEQNLKISEANQKAIFNNILDMAWLKDSEGRFIAVNEAFTKTTYLNIENVIGKTDLDLWPFDIAERYRHQDIEVMSSGKNKFIEETLTNKYGNIIWLEIVKTPIYNEQGEVIGTTGMARDITARRKAEEALRESEERFRQIAETIHLVFFMNSADLNKIIYISPAYEKIWDRNCQSLYENPAEWIDSVHPEDRDRVKAAFVRQIEGLPFLEQYRIVRPDGQIRWILARSFPVRNEAGKVYRYAGFAEDISDRKQAEQERIELIESLGAIAANLREAERRWRFLLENVQLAVVVLDNNYRIEYVNPFFVKLVDYTKEELLGKDWYDLLVPSDQETLTIKNSQAWENYQYTQASSPSNTYSYCPLTCFLIPSPAGPYCDTSLSSSSSSIPSIILTKSGEKKVIAWKNTLLKNSRSEVISTMSIGEDITERQILERIKDEFISIVSHEIRTPLTAIYATLGMLSKGVIKPECEKGKRALRIAARNTERLVQLVNDILDLERLESGNMTLIKQTCNVAELLQRSTYLMEMIANEANINLLLNFQDVQCYADPDRIIQVLTNLISNAIKFSPPGATIWLSAELQEQEENKQNPFPYSLSLPFSHLSFPAFPAILFKIKDQGRGIAPEKMEAIFDRFHQIDASDTRQKGGTGLGLAICRSIVQQHGGQIWVESNLNEGSTFYFTLPLKLV